MNIGGHNHYTPAEQKKKDYFWSYKECWEKENPISESDFIKLSLKECKRLCEQARREFYEKRAKARGTICE